MIINEISKGITHIEDLGVDEFLNVLIYLNEYEITEKVDGAQILFGLDKNGLYTSRETKGGVRVYNPGDYGVSFPTTYMRSAHRLLEMVYPDLMAAGLKPGDQVEAEVLYGELPNVVPYSEDRSYLIFLRTTEGEVNIDRLKERLDGRSLDITQRTPITDDGRDIYTSDVTVEWMFSRAPKISINVESLRTAIAPHAAKMTAYLRESSGICGQPNHVIESMPLNKRPEWCRPEDWKDVKEEAKAKRIEYQHILREGHMAKIKEVLLNRIVRKQRSEFGPPIEEGGWIEGVVLRHTETGKMVKIVDKEVFGVLRESAWKARNQLTESARSTDGNLSFLGNLKVALATSLGHPELGTMQAKNYLRKAGTITEERIANLSTGIRLDVVKEYWLNLLECQTELLGSELDKYEEETSSQEGHVWEGIKRRTLETFASTFALLEDMRFRTSQAVQVEDLITILAGKQLADI